MDTSRSATPTGQLHAVHPARREGCELTRVGVVGYGYWGSKHVRVLAGLPGVEVTVIESQRDRLLDAMTAFPSVRLASCLDDVRDALDAVVIATPPRSHGPLALRALQAGLHVLVEKPMATTVAAAEAIAEAADGSGSTLMVGHTFEYNAAVWKLKEIISSGELGRILYINTSRLNLGRYQNDCNVIWDLGPHDISIISYLLGEFPDLVSVWAQRNLGNHHADVAFLRLNFPSAPAFVHLSWLDPNKVRRVTVVGDRKMAVYDDLSDNERIRIYDVGADFDETPASHAMPVTYRTGEIASPYIHFVEPLLVQDSHFIDCVRTGCRPQTSGERGLGIVRALAATDEAIASGGPARVQRTILKERPTSVAGSEVAS